MNEPHSSDDLPFLDDLPVTPTPEQKPEQTPSPGAPGKTEPVETAETKPEAPPPDAESTRPAAPQAPAPPVSAPAPEKQPTMPVEAQTHPAPPAEPPSHPAPPVEPQSHPVPPVEPERKRAVIPPAILARRMQRYSIYLIVAAFLLVGANYDALNLSAVLWFAAGLTAGFAILCAVAVVLLNAIAWNFDRLRDELRGGREVVDLRE